MSLTHEVLASRSQSWSGAAVEQHNTAALAMLLRAVVLLALVSSYTAVAAGNTCRCLVHPSSRAVASALDWRCAYAPRLPPLLPMLAVLERPLGPAMLRAL